MPTEISPSQARSLIDDARTAAANGNLAHASELAWNASTALFSDYVAAEDRLFLTSQPFAHVADHAAKRAQEPRISTWWAAATALRNKAAEDELTVDFVRDYLKQVSLLINTLEPLLAPPDTDPAQLTTNALARAREQLQSGDTLEPFRTASNAVAVALQVFAELYGIELFTDNIARRVAERVSQENCRPEILERFDEAAADLYFVQLNPPHPRRTEHYLNAVSLFMEAILPIMPR